MNIQTILDIGANVGQFVHEIKRYLPDTKIYCFEPLQSEFGKLMENTKKFKYIDIFNIALGDFNGKTVIHKNEFSPASSLLQLTELSRDIYPYISQSTQQEIIINKLDDFIMSSNIEIKPEILVKIDVQGFEDKVIMGGIDTLKKVKVLIIEVEFQEIYKDQLLFDDIYQILKDIGFTFKGILSTNLSQHDGFPVFADALFLRPKNDKVVS